MMEGGRGQRMKKVERRVTRLVSRILITHTHVSKMAAARMEEGVHTHLQSHAVTVIFLRGCTLTH